MLTLSENSILSPLMRKKNKSLIPTHNDRSTKKKNRKKIQMFSFIILCTHQSSWFDYVADHETNN